MRAQHNLQRTGPALCQTPEARRVASTGSRMSVGSSLLVHETQNTHENVLVVGQNCYSLDILDMRMLAK